MERMELQRVETGPLQIGEDWPGLFVRGDNAAGYAAALGVVLAKMPADDWAHGQVLGLLADLQSCIVRDGKDPEGLQWVSGGRIEGPPAGPGLFDQVESTPEPQAQLPGLRPGAELPKASAIQSLEDLCQAYHSRFRGSSRWERGPSPPVGLRTTLSEGEMAQVRRVGTDPSLKLLHAGLSPCAAYLSDRLMVAHFAHIIPTVFVPTICYRLPSGALVVLRLKPLPLLSLLTAEEGLALVGGIEEALFDLADQPVIESLKRIMDGAS